MVVTLFVTGTFNLLNKYCSFMPPAYYHVCLYLIQCTMYYESLGFVICLFGLEFGSAQVSFSFPLKCELIEIENVRELS